VTTLDVSGLVTVSDINLTVKNVVIKMYGGRSVDLSELRLQYGQNTEECSVPEPTPCDQFASHSSSDFKLVSSSGDPVTIYRALYDHPDGIPFHYNKPGNSEAPYLVHIKFSEPKGVKLEGISFELHGPETFEIYSGSNQIKVCLLI
jgi:hypothetical protein